MMANARRGSLQNTMFLSDPDVHHVHNSCPTGQRIHAHHRRAGTGGHPLCKHCQRMYLTMVQQARKPG